MNILIINWRDLKNPLYGGAEIHIEKIAQYLAKKHKVYFLSSKFKNCKKIEEENSITYIRIGNELLFNYHVYAKLNSIVKKYNIDFIIEDINKIPFYSPLFVNIPVLVVIPHIFGKTIFYQTNPIFASYVYLSEKPIKYVYKNSYFEVISDSTGEDLIRRGIEKEKIKVIVCGIDKEKYENNIEKSKEPLFVYVGRLKKYKSVQHIIYLMERVIKKMPNVKLKIVGAGDYSDALKALVKEKQLEKYIEFTGFVSEEEKIKILKQAWVSIYPSLIEGWGIVNIEANISETPVLCANVPGLRDSVKNGYSGLLYEYGNIDDMYEKLMNIIDENNFVTFTENAKKWAMTFNWDETGRLSEEWIEFILNKEKE